MMQTLPRFSNRGGSRREQRGGGGGGGGVPSAGLG